MISKITYYSDFHMNVRLQLIKIDFIQRSNSTYSRSMWWFSLTKNMQTEQLLCWSGMTDTEHS